MIRFSLTNLVETAPTITGSSNDAVYVAANIRTAQRPFLPWKTTALGAQNIVIDFGTATTLTSGVVALIHTNYVSFSVQGNATDSWGAPTYNQAVTVTSRSPSGRINQAHRIVGTFNLRFLRISIPNQSTSDGASVYRTGGVWAGLFSSPPRDIKHGPAEDRSDAFADLSPVHGGWTARNRLGDPRYVISAEQLAHDETELANWRELERQIEVVDYFLACIRETFPSDTAVMRRTDAPQWQHNRIWMTSQITLEEVVR